MISTILGHLFPPEAGGTYLYGSVLLARIESGELAPIVLDPPEGGVVSVKEWTGNGWKTIGPSEKSGG